MTKLKIDPEYEQGLSRKSDIDDLIAGRRKPAAKSGLPTWLSDAFQLVMAAGVGGACAWLGIKLFM